MACELASSSLELVISKKSNVTQIKKLYLCLLIINNNFKQNQLPKTCNINVALNYVIYTLSYPLSQHYSPVSTLLLLQAGSHLPEELAPVSLTVLNQKRSPSAPSFDRELIFIRDANL